MSTVVASAGWTLITPLLTVLSDLDPVPKPADVKAGYPALFLFLGLLAVVGLLGWSLSRHLRTADHNRRAGLFGDQPEADEASAATEPAGVADPTEPTNR